MSSELKLRQKTVVDLLASHGEILRDLTADHKVLLEEIAGSFEEQLKEQGVPFYAEEALAALTALETVSVAGSGEEISHDASLLRLALISKLSEAWTQKNKGFFVD